MSEEIVFDGKKLDELIEKADGTGIPVEKGANYHTQQFYYLLRKVLGEYVTYSSENNPDGRTQSFILENATEGLRFCFYCNPNNSRDYARRTWTVNNFPSFKVNRRNIGSAANIVEELELEVKSEAPGTRYAWYFVTSTGEYSPIKIIAHNKEGFEKAKIFGQVYNQISGAKVTIVKEHFDDGEQIDDLVEQAEKTPLPLKKKRHNPEITAEDLEKMHQQKEGLV